MQKIIGNKLQKRNSRHKGQQNDKKSILDRYAYLLKHIKIPWKEVNKLHCIILIYMNQILTAQQTEEISHELYSNVISDRLQQQAKLPPYKQGTEAYGSSLWQLTRKPPCHNAMVPPWWKFDNTASQDCVEKNTTCKYKFITDKLIFTISI